MKLLRVSAAVINTTPLDWAGNRRHISGAMGAARAAGASILCLPELCLTGYGCEDAFHAPGRGLMMQDKAVHNKLVFVTLRFPHSLMRAG